MDIVADWDLSRTFWYKKAKIHRGNTSTGSPINSFLVCVAVRKAYRHVVLVSFLSGLDIGVVELLYDTKRGNAVYWGTNARVAPSFLCSTCEDFQQNRGKGKKKWQLSAPCPTHAGAERARFVPNS